MYGSVACYYEYVEFWVDINEVGHVTGITVLEQFWQEYDNVLKLQINERLENVLTYYVKHCKYGQIGNLFVKKDSLQTSMYT